MASWKDLGGPARPIGAAISKAVAATGDEEAYEKAVADLSALPAGLILGGLVRSLLEDQHPDGLDSDDIEAVLVRCYRSASWTAVDANVLLAVLASALGIHEAGVTYEDITAPETTEADEWTSAPIGSTGGDEAVPSEHVTKPPSPTEYARHAPILIADLLTAGRRSLDYYLDAAFTELVRAETMEMP